MNRRSKDFLASKIMSLATVFSSLFLFIMAFVLFSRSSPILATQPLSELLLSSSWHPSKCEFGFYPFVISTFWVTGIALIFATPICLLSATYLAEYAPSKIRGIMKPLIDLLAGIPSVVYGLWSVLTLVPLIRDYITPFVGATNAGYGYTVLTGGLVLAVMISPIIISVSEEVFRAVPYEVREASLALGATRWQTVKHVTIRSALPGVAAAIILGFSRAFGETMAVLMVVGNVPEAPSSVFDPGYPLLALIANTYGDMMSIPLYDSAMMLAALVLLGVVLFFNIVARLVLLRIKKRSM